MYTNLLASPYVHVHVDVDALLPIILLLVTLLTNIIIPVVLPHRHVQTVSFLVTLVGLGLTSWQTKPPAEPCVAIWHNLLQHTHWTTIIQLLSIGITLVMGAVMYQEDKLYPAKENLSFIFVLVLLLGAYLLPISQHWLMVYTSVTFITIASTVLIYSYTNHQQGILRSQQYLLYSSAIASGFMLFGISYVYGYTGSLDVSQGLITATHAAGWGRQIAQIGFLLALGGVLMLLGSFPYQFWVADVYTTAPCYLAAYLSTITKVVVIGWLGHLCYTLHVTEVATHFLMFRNLLPIIATITMGIGHFAALRTQHVGKLFAYGGIAQTGALLALLVPDVSSYRHIVYYLVVYSIMNMASWLSLGLLYKKVNSFHLADYTGLGKKFPIVSACITVSTLALIGLPPTSGFIAKFVLLNKLWECVQQTPNSATTILWMASILGTIMALYYYLRVPYTLFSRAKKPNTTTVVREENWVQWIVVVLACLLIALVLAF